MKIAACLALALVLASPRGVPCPDTAAGETALDCPWADVARRLTAAADAGRPLGPLLAEVAPGLAEQLGRDARLDGFKALWGESSNVDANQGGTSVDPRVVDFLLAAAKAPPRDGATAHAGILHTYGYMLSNLSTPFGFKRKRWVAPDIELGFQLAAGSLGPRSPEGSLFQNVTYFAGRIAFRDDPATRERLESAAPADVRKNFAPFPFARLTPKRLTETVTTGERRVTLRTDLVPFLHPVPGSSNAALLIYSVHDSAGETARLITVFPVSTKFTTTALDGGGLGADQPIVTRYNAVVPGVTGANPPVRGTRVVR